MKQPLLFSKFASDKLERFFRKQIFTNQFKKTLKFITFLLLMFYTTISVAQTISFTYDAAGNRTIREIVFKSSKTTFNSNLDTISSIKPFTDMMGKMKITIFPNPTKGQLSVEIKNMPINASGEIRIYNVSGNIIQYQKTVGSLNLFDFSPYSTGIYFLQIKVGQDESKWKIIKQ